MTDRRSRIKSWILALTSEFNSRLEEQNLYTPEDHCYQLETTGMEALNLTDDEFLEGMEEELEVADPKDAESLTDDKLENLVNAAWINLC